MTAAGWPVDIPVIIRTLGMDMFRFGIKPRESFRPSLELIGYLDGHLSCYGPDDPALDITLFNHNWWTNPKQPRNPYEYLSHLNIRTAIMHFKKELDKNVKPNYGPRPLTDISDQLNKPPYIWHQSINDDLPDIQCTRCRLYRSVALGVMDQVRDLSNTAQACKKANVAEREISIRRASGFNELYEAALNKEAGSESVKRKKTGSPSKGRKRVTQDIVPEVEDLKRWTTDLWKLANQNAEGKWVWGVDLTDEDLRTMVRGGDLLEPFMHSGYDLSYQDCDSKSASHEDASTESMPLTNDVVSGSVQTIPDVEPEDFCGFSVLLLEPSGQNMADSEPDPVHKMFAEAARKRQRRAKQVMQDEVDQPQGWYDHSDHSLYTIQARQPWPTLQLPTVSLPANIYHEGHGDEIVFPESEDMQIDTDFDRLEIADPDDDQDHLIISDSESTSGDLRFPTSDDSGDVLAHGDHIAESLDPGTVLMTVENIVFPESPFPNSPVPNLRVEPRFPGTALRNVAFGRDPQTGRFTPASFYHIPDTELE